MRKVLDTLIPALKSEHKSDVLKSEQPFLLFLCTINTKSSVRRVTMARMYFKKKMKRYAFNLKMTPFELAKATEGQARRIQDITVKPSAATFFQVPACNKQRSFHTNGNLALATALKPSTHKIIQSSSYTTKLFGWQHLFSMVLFYCHQLAGRDKVFLKRMIDFKVTVFPISITFKLSFEDYNESDKFK